MSEYEFPGQWIAERTYPPQYRIVRWAGEGYDEVPLSQLKIPDQEVSDMLKSHPYLQKHALGDGSWVILPLNVLEGEPVEKFTARLLLVAQLYGLDTQDANKVVQFCVAMHIIDADPIGEFRGDHSELGLDLRWRVVDINKTEE